MKRFAVLLVVVAVLAAAPSQAANVTPEKSLLSCQKEAGKRLGRYGKVVFTVLTKCLDKAQADLETGQQKAGKSCLSGLPKIHSGTEHDGYFGHIERQCHPGPGHTGVTHNNADVVGPSVGTPSVTAPLYSRNLENLCEGVLDTPIAWVRCLERKSKCDLVSAVTIAYPRILDLLDLVEGQIQLLEESQEKITSLSTLDELKKLVEGGDPDDPNDPVAHDGVPDIDCGS